jgi:hypothetical protein
VPLLETKKLRAFLNKKSKRKAIALFVVKKYFFVTQLILLSLL